jgi:serine/threonine protein kinase
MTDFGVSVPTALSFIATRTVDDTVTVGTVRWAAPESISQKPVVDQKSDIYGLGIVLWEIASRQIPFVNIDDVAVIALVKYGHERPGVPSNCPKLVSRIFTRCWDQNPQKRPSADEVYKYFVKKSSSFKRKYPGILLFKVAYYNLFFLYSIPPSNRLTRQVYNKSKYLPHVSLTGRKDFAIVL